MKRVESYYDSMYIFACNWVKTRMKPFTVEDIKEAYYRVLNKTTQHGSIHGKLLQHLMRNELIFKNGYTEVRRPNNKMKVVNVFISKEYRIRQRENRLMPYKQQTQLF